MTYCTVQTRSAGRRQCRGGWPEAAAVGRATEEFGHFRRGFGDLDVAHPSSLHAAAATATAAAAVATALAPLEKAACTSVTARHHKGPKANLLGNMRAVCFYLQVP